MKTEQLNGCYKIKNLLFWKYASILLPSNRKRGIDFDLKQQKRKLNKQFKEIEEDTNNIKFYFDQLSNTQKKFVKKLAINKNNFTKEKYLGFLTNKRRKEVFANQSKHFTLKRKVLKVKKIDNDIYLERKTNLINQIMK